MARVKKVKPKKRVAPKVDPFRLRYIVETRIITGEAESDEFVSNLEKCLNVYGVDNWVVNSIDSLGNEKYLFIASRVERREPSVRRSKG